MHAHAVTLRIPEPPCFVWCAYVCVHLCVHLRLRFCVCGFGVLCCCLPSKPATTLSLGTSGRIHSVAGPELELECQRLGFTPTGEAKTSKVLWVPGDPSLCTPPAELNQEYMRTL